MADIAPLTDFNAIEAIAAISKTDPDGWLKASHLINDRTALKAYAEALAAESTAAVPDLVEDALADSSTLTAAATAAAGPAVNTAVAGLKLIQGETDYGGESVLVLSDKDDRILLEFGEDGYLTPYSSQLVTTAIQALVGLGLGVESVPGTATYALTDLDGRELMVIDSTGLLTESSVPTFASLGIEHIDDDSGYSVIIRDVNDRIIMGWDESGNVAYPSIASAPADGSITLAKLAPDATARLNPTVRYVPEISGGNLYTNELVSGRRYLISTGNSPTGAASREDGYTTWTDANGSWAKKSDGTGLTVPAFPSRGSFSSYGTSYTAGPGSNGDYTYQLAALLNAGGGSIVGNNFGYNSASSADVATRHGALQPLCTVTGDTIPASGPVTVTTISPSDGWRDSGGTTSFQWTGTLAGVPGVLLHNFASGNVFTFTRTTGGSTVACPPGTPFICTETAAQKITDFQIIETGRNNIFTAPSPDITMAIRDMTTIINDPRRPYSKQMLVLGGLPLYSESIGSSGYVKMRTLNDTLTATFGDAFSGGKIIDTHRQFMSRVVDYCSRKSITLDSTDLNRINVLDCPPQILFGDTIHPNANGYGLYAEILFDVIRNYKKVL